MDEWKSGLMQEARAAGLIQKEHQPDEPAPKWFVMAVALNILAYIKDGGKAVEG